MLISETCRLLDKYRPLLLGFLLLCFAFSGHSQTYNPSTCCSISNKAYGPAQSVSTDGRSWFYDATNFVMRDYNGTTEVFSYLNLPKYRSGHFPIFVHSGGMLQMNGVWIGGITLVYWFKDSTGNANLVRWYTDSTGIPGGPFYAVANNLSEGDAGLIKGNLALDNVDNTSDAVKNAAAVSLTNHTIDANNNTLLHIPNSALTNNSIGLTLNNTGATPQVTTTPAALGSSLVLTLPWANGSDSGLLRGTDWSTFDNKNDSTTISNDTLYNWVNGTRTFQSVIAGTGGVNTVNGTNTSLLFSPTTGNVLGQVNPAFNFNWTGQHTFNSFAPIFSTLATAGGLFYGDGSGQLVQSGAGTTGQILQSAGGTAPNFFTPDATTVDGWLGYTPLSGTLGSAHIFVGNGSNIATDVPVTGDVTLSNTGVTTIGNNKVTYAKIQAASGQALLGAPGAGNYQEIILGTNLSITGSTLNAASSAPTFQQTLTNGSTLTIPNTVTMGGHRFRWSGAADLHDSVYINTSDSVYTHSLTGKGTSYTAGLVGPTSPALCYVAILAQKLGCSLVNLGINSLTLQNTAPTNPWGATTNGVADTVNTPVYSTTKQLLTLEYGINDYRWIGTNWDTVHFKAAYRLVLNNAIAKGWPLSRIKLFTPVILGQTQFNTDSAANGFTSACTPSRALTYVDAIKKIGIEYGIQAVDVSTAFRDFELPSLLMFSDSIHPSNQGHRFYAEYAASQIGYNIQLNGQQLTANGAVTEISSLKVRTPIQSYTTNITPVALDSVGNFINANNLFILNNPPQQQGAMVNVTGVNAGWVNPNWLRVTGLIPQTGGITGMPLSGSAVDIQFGGGMGFISSATRNTLGVTTAPLPLIINPSGSFVGMGSGAAQHNSSQLDVAGILNTTNAAWFGSTSSTTGTRILNGFFDNMASGGNVTLRGNSAANTSVVSLQSNGNFIVGQTGTDSSSGKFQVGGASWFSDTVILKNVRNGSSTDSVAVLHQLSAGRFVLQKIAQTSLGGGVTTVGPFSSSSIANGGSVSGAVLTLGVADGTNPGLLSTAAQTIAGVKTLSSNLSVAHIISTTGTGTITAGAGAGTGPSVSVVGNDLSGDITVTTGTLPTAGAVVVTLNYVSAFPNNSFPLIYPANAATALLSGVTMVYSSGTTTAMQINAGTTALTPATTYLWHYMVTGN